MDPASSLESFDFYSPVVFRIEVKGAIDSEMSDMLGGMKLFHYKKDKVNITRLEGKILDQTALMGILSTLYDMRLPIIMIKRIN
jgi:hypothetical protein